MHMPNGQHMVDSVKFVMMTGGDLILTHLNKGHMTILPQIKINFVKGSQTTGVIYPINRK